MRQIAVMQVLAVFQNWQSLPETGIELYRESRKVHQRPQQHGSYRHSEKQQAEDGSARDKQHDRCRKHYHAAELLAPHHQLGKPLAIAEQPLVTSILNRMADFVGGHRYRR